LSSTTTFAYEPGEHETEKASNSYLMSLIAAIAGLPLPIINLLATLIFYLGNRKGTYFVRWHCTQALISQFSLLAMNSAGFWWTVSIIFSDKTISSNYIAYIITIHIRLVRVCYKWAVVNTIKYTITISVRITINNTKICTGNEWRI